MCRCTKLKLICCKCMYGQKPKKFYFKILDTLEYIERVSLKRNKLKEAFGYINENR